uniref:Uncharacterized protein n=1 Tax=Megaselia scalaris TaxID=36166 RepID=T1GFJ5_MEGSC
MKHENSNLSTLKLDRNCGSVSEDRWEASERLLPIFFYPTVELKSPITGFISKSEMGKYAFPNWLPFASVLILTVCYRYLMVHNVYISVNSFPFAHQRHHIVFHS